eukprot:NODE_130_length_16779_cov_1.687410.p12 type:complete len:203 gc:universal NODE_130_length_16779_cov_1.687410:374-982(+)
MASPAQYVAFADKILGKAQKQGIYQNKRAYYFKATEMKPHVDDLLEKVEIENIKKGTDLLQKLLELNFIVRVKRFNTKIEEVKRLEPVADTDFKLKEIIDYEERQVYYMWLYQGNPLWNMLKSVGMVVLVLVGVMYPLWPSQMKHLSYYASWSVMGFMGVILSLGNEFLLRGHTNHCVCHHYFYSFSWPLAFSQFVCGCGFF